MAQHGADRDNPVAQSLIPGSSTSSLSTFVAGADAGSSASSVKDWSGAGSGPGPTCLRSPNGYRTLIDEAPTAHVIGATLTPEPGAAGPGPVSLRGAAQVHGALYAALGFATADDSGEA